MVLVRPRASVVKPLRIRDTQRSKVYAWENSKSLRVWDWPLISEAKTHKLIGSICSQMGEKSPIITFQKEGNCALANDVRMIFPKDALRLPIILHEVAHVLSMRWWEQLEPHGGEWLGVYSSLLKAQLDIPHKKLLAQFQERGLTIFEFTPPLSRR